MERRSNKLSRTLVVLLLAALLMSMPGAALAQSYQAKVTSKQMYVAADARGKKLVGRLGQGTQVTVLATANGVARIQYMGRVGYARTSDLKAIETQSSQSAQAVTNTNTYAFQKPNTRSAKAKVRKGTRVNVLAIRGTVAMVEKSGVIAYMYTPHLTLERQVEPPEVELPQQPPATQTPQPPKLPSVEEAYKSGNYSVEQICYLFLTQKMGYNNAAAAGVLSNIYYESTFRPTLGGDSGTSYGICQWHASRKTRLKNFCKEHDLDMSTLQAQLLFLKYELETYYPKVDRYMKGVENSAQGAYDAAYYFCYNYEAPASKASKSVTRGNRAQNTYYPKYANV